MKRLDLQGIRGIAILAVLLFHYFGDTFPNGYIGVDMFFVLSGYLMTMILGSSKSLDSASIQQFYYRRIKRIVPLFMFTIFGATLLVFLLFPPTFISINCDSAFTSMFLYRNLARHSDRNEYFKMLNQADDIFTHTWSLSVEMQFYVHAPLLLLVASKCHDYRILYASTVFIASLAYHLLADSDTSFNSVFCRIWQFVAGSFAFNISEYFKELDVNPKNEFLLLDQDDHDDDDLDIEQASPKLRGPSLPRLPFQTALYISLILLLILSFFPEELPSKILRITCTLLTAVIITAGTLVDQNPLNNRHLVYFGDISYALYLVHWPLYVYVKFTYPDDHRVFTFAVTFSIILAILISETYERFYLSLAKPAIAILIISLYASTAFLIINQDAIADNLNQWRYGEMEAKVREFDNADFETNKFANISVEKAIILMKKWAKDEPKMLILPNCFPNRTEHGFCEFQNSTLKGTLLTYVIGNSYTANIGDLVHDQLISPLSGNITEDRVYQEALKTLRIYETMIKKRIYLLDSVTIPKSPNLSKYAERLEAGESVKQNDFVVDMSYKNGRRRLRELVKRCLKCELINISPYFYDAHSEKCFDEKTKLGYFFNGGHLTPMAKQMIYPEFQRIANDFEY
ncbi:unnamed protein product [Caenorhabditis bovis]|uniref:Acyltransferase n=1 Tax=Caenorhabditis bovis TaxID=2654633 RepID=A0A8S1ESY9_9PELO|nr:unnamed protein product [Caenorhabditis bovis]